MNLLNKKINKETFMAVYNEKCIGHQYIPSILPSVPRLIVMGDLHGDFNLLIKLLHMGKLINVDQLTGEINWQGGSTYVVQVGDQIDRCRPINNMQCSNPNTTHNDEASDIRIMNLCNKLHQQALRMGGAFISLLGNHEILNASGVLTYVSHLGQKEFENYVDPLKPEIKFASGAEARAYAFAPGNEIGKMMGCTRLGAIIIGEHLFVHAGLVDGLINEIGLTNKADLETINIAIRMWLLGLLKKKYIKKIIQSSKNSMFWTRILGNIPPNVQLNNPACIDHIGKILKMFSVGSIIIGHTPQSFNYSDDINQTCSGKVWRVDNGSSSAFDKFDYDILSKGTSKYSRRPQVLEIINGSQYYILDGTIRKQIHPTN